MSAAASDAFVVPPPRPFEALVRRWPAGRPLQRISIDNLGATEFSSGPTRRFGPFDARSGRVSTLYLAETVEGALMEVVFHDVDLTEHEPTVYLSDMRRHRRSTVFPTRDLLFARLDDEALEAMDVARAHLIETPPRSYRHTVEWARAAHGEMTVPVDGLVWNSRRHRSSQAFVLFGDRVERRIDLDVDGPPIPLMHGTGYEEMLEVATRHNIIVVH